ncbi:MAG: type 4a pilus biogenesis protein PilO [Planctomycetota bacterium]
MKFGFRELLFVALLVAMPVSAYFYVFKPRAETIQKVNADTQHKRAKLAKLDEVMASHKIHGLGVEIEKLAQAIELYEQRLPQREEVDGILEDVWRVAVANKLEPLSVRTQQVIGTATYSELPIRMKIKGDFDGFYQFLLDVEKLPRITRLPDLKLTKSKDKDTEGQMVAELTLSIFFEGDEPDTAQRPGGNA